MTTVTSLVGGTLMASPSASAGEANPSSDAIEATAAACVVYYGSTDSFIDYGWTTSANCWHTADVKCKSSSGNVQWYIYSDNSLSWASPGSTGNWKCSTNYPNIADVVPHTHA
jgi:hypothetical protein